MLRKFRNWRKQDQGVVAVEFAMIALPFFTLLLGTVEMSLFYASSVVLEGASEAAARVVRTGQAQGDPETAFKNKLCGMVDALIPCDALVYEAIVMPGNTFAEAEGLAPNYDADGELVPGGFNAGSASDVVLIRTSYKYTFFVPMIGYMVSGGSNYANLTSTVVIKNEPYTFG